MAHRYWTWERITLVAAMFNLVFVPVALLSHPHWGAIGSALFTWKPLPGGLTQETVLILLSNIGATVTPWMLFFQQSAIADKGLTTHDIRFGRIDTVLGATLAALAALATIVAPLRCSPTACPPETSKPPSSRKPCSPSSAIGARRFSLSECLKPAWSRP